MVKHNRTYGNFGKTSLPDFTSNPVDFIGFESGKEGLYESSPKRQRGSDYSDYEETVDAGSAAFIVNNQYKPFSISSDNCLYYPTKPFEFYCGKPNRNVTYTMPSGENCDSVIFINSKYRKDGDKREKVILMVQEDSQFVSDIKAYEHTVKNHFFKVSQEYKDKKSSPMDQSLANLYTARNFVSSFKENLIEDYVTLDLKLVFSPSFSRTAMFDRVDRADINSAPRSTDIEEIENGWYFSTNSIAMGFVWIRQGSWGISWFLKKCLINGPVPDRMGLDQLPISDDQSKDELSTNAFLSFC